MTRASETRCDINSRKTALGPRAGALGMARLREADHRIANGMLFAAARLRHEGRRIKSVQDARDVLNAAADRLNAIAHLHRQLSQAQPDQDVELSQFFGRFCENVAHSTGVIFDLHLGDATLPADMAGQICVVLNELATNARKHGAGDGQPVIVTLKAKRSGPDRLCLIVRDNGRGLPADFSLEDSSGLGMIVVTSTVEKLGGRIRVLPGAGAGFGIDLPTGGGRRLSQHADGRLG